jgi:hypothetical protein
MKKGWVVQKGGEFLELRAAPDDVASLQNKNQPVTDTLISPNPL